MKNKFFPCLFAFYLILGSWKGYLALFEQDAWEPRQIFPMAVEALPEQDQAALDQGIPIHNERDLNQLLEDYLS